MDGPTRAQSKGEKDTELASEVYTISGDRLGYLSTSATPIKTK